MAIALALLAAAVAPVSGCGDDEATTSPPTTTPPPTPPRDGGQARPPVGDGEGGVALTELGDFDQPLYVTQPPGEQRDLYVVERTGAIRVIDDGKVRPQPFLDVAGLITDGFNEQGLLSAAFAPDYRSSGRFYVYYTDTDGDIRVVEYRRSAGDPLQADPGSARPLLRIEHSENDNHNGGLALFGPDRLLYIGVGDGGSAGDPDRNGQNLSVLLGKILRIDPLPQGGRPYGIPQGNPFAGQPGARPEIFQYGLRNPWRFSFDPGTGAEIIGDVGQDNFEEVDYLPRGEQAGANLGWSAFEGDARYNEDQQAPGAVPPILTYSLEGGACAVTGGFVVRDRSLRSLYGRYLYGDYCAGELRSFIPSATEARADRPLGQSVSQLSSFGEDNRGHVYATSLTGPVYRLDPG